MSIINIPEMESESLNNTINSTLEVTAVNTNSSVETSMMEEQTPGEKIYIIIID
jgi:hypothetical protein